MLVTTTIGTWDLFHCRLMSLWGSDLGFDLCQLPTGFNCLALVMIG